MFTDMEAAIYFEANEEGSRIRAEMVVLACAATEAGFLEILGKYGMLDEDVDAEGKALVKDLLRQANQRTIDAVFEIETSELREKYDILKEAAVEVEDTIALMEEEESNDGTE